ncbi:MAG: erythromycin esterase family protein [Streptosporangiaceae bacterium]
MATAKVARRPRARPVTLSWLELCRLRTCVSGPANAEIEGRRKRWPLERRQSEDTQARDRTVNVRDAAQADTVDWILQRQQRIVVAAHNAHLQRWPVELPGAIPRMNSAGEHLAERWGEDSLVIGTTSGSGQALTAGEGFASGQFFDELPPPEPGTLDALMAASHDGPFAVDLRRLPSADREAVGAITRQRSGGFSCPIDPLAAYDLLVHLPRVTAAQPDPDAAVSAPAEVTAPFRTWMSSRS